MLNTAASLLQMKMINTESTCQDILEQQVSFVFMYTYTCMSHLEDLLLRWTVHIRLLRKNDETNIYVKERETIIVHFNNPTRVLQLEYKL